MVWIEFEALWLFCPERADVVIGRKPFESLESSGEVVGDDEVCAVTAQLITDFRERAGAAAP
jgi:hypothetical protein